MGEQLIGDGCDGPMKCYVNSNTLLGKDGLFISAFVTFAGSLVEFIIFTTVLIMTISYEFFFWLNLMTRDIEKMFLRLPEWKSTIILVNCISFQLIICRAILLFNRLSHGFFARESLQEMEINPIL